MNARMHERDGGHAVRTRVRRRSRTALTAAGVVNVVSAVTAPLAARISVVGGLLPLNARESAAATAAVSGVVLVVVAAGLRRGHRRAWLAAVTILTVAVVANIVKGLDIQEAAASATLAVYLIVHRSAFRTATDPAMTRRVARIVACTAVTGTSAGLVALAVAASRDRPVNVGVVVAAVARRARWANQFVGTNSMLVLAAAAAAGSGAWMLLRPNRMPPTLSTDLRHARDIISRYGTGTLDYFALRDDKHHWFDGHTVVAYSVLNGVCLVSPDPVGPLDERVTSWAGFHAFADGHGWSTAVLGATAAWLPIYQRAGMRAVYLGDEGRRRRWRVPARRRPVQRPTPGREPRRPPRLHRRARRPNLRRLDDQRPAHRARHAKPAK